MIEISLSNIKKSYRFKNILDNLNIEIKNGDKVSLIGENGCGKSTLLKAIINEHNLGIKLGSNVKIGYVPQQINFEKDDTLLDYSKRYFISDEAHLISALSKFQFYGDDVFKKVSKLSGGEKVRLRLFSLIQEKCNFIILDEPTNHIDIFTKENLVEALKEFRGTLLFVSHDRYFINQLVNKILYISDKKITEYCGNYEYFISCKNTNN